MHSEITKFAPPSQITSTWIPRVLGFVLLTAAGLKAYGFNVDPVARSGIFSGSAVQFLVIIFEMGLGVWLLSGQQRPGAWIAAMLTFTAFAGVSCYQGVIGRASCGCLGSKVTVNPWVMFIFDLAAIAALLLARPDLKPLWNDRDPIARAGFRAIGGLVVFSCVFYASIYAAFGSLPAAIAYFRDEKVSVYPRLVDVGDGQPGEVRKVTVEVTNWTAEPIRIFGGTSDCACTVLGDLPMTIPAKETRPLSVDMSLKGSPGMFTRKAALLVDVKGYQVVAFDLTGRVIGP